MTSLEEVKMRTEHHPFNVINLEKIRANIKAKFRITVGVPRCRRPFYSHHCLRHLSKYECKKCRFTTVFKVELTKHLSAHVSNTKGKIKDSSFPPHKCQHCFFTTYSKFILLKHIVQKCKWFRLNGGSFKLEPYGGPCIRGCVDCNSGLERYLRRKLRTPQDGRVNCGISNIIKQDKSVRVLPHKNDSHFCYKCLYNASCFLDLKRHYFSRHSKVITLMKPIVHQNQKRVIKWFCCDKCPYMTSTVDVLRTHKLNEHPDKSSEVGIVWFYCDQCSYKTEWKGSLRIHKLMKHCDQSTFETDLT